MNTRKRLIIQIIAAIAAIILLSSCQREREFRTEIAVDPVGAKYELRFNGEPYGIAHGDTIIYMAGDVSCVAGELLEPGTIHLVMWMSRSWDNTILYDGDRCVNAASGTAGIIAVCKSGSECGE